MANDREQLRDQAAEYLRESVISGQARPGVLLRLGPIAEALDMSLTPVREALLLLAQSGWVVQEPNRGFRVARLSRSDVLDAYYVNRTIAGELAARAAPRVDDETIASLRALDDRVRAADEHEDADRVTRWNTQMHRQIYSSADAPRLVFFVESASLFVPRHFWGRIPGWWEHNREGHVLIIDALESHDTELSRKVMAAHIAAAGELLVDFLDANGTFSAEVSHASDGPSKLMFSSANAVTGGRSGG